MIQLKEEYEKIDEILDMIFEIKEKNSENVSLKTAAFMLNSEVVRLKKLINNNNTNKHSLKLIEKEKEDL